MGKYLIYLEGAIRTIVTFMDELTTDRCKMKQKGLFISYPILVGQMFQLGSTAVS